MIENFGFKEHIKRFTEMFNHLRNTNENLDVTTAVETVKSKVMIEQLWEAVTHNLNVEDVNNAPMLKDFEIWANVIEDILMSGRDISHFQLDEITFEPPPHQNISSDLPPPIPDGY